MVTAHRIVAFLVIAVSFLAAVAAFVASRRRRGAGRVVAQILALAQTIVVAQVVLGLVLVGEHRRPADRLHYMYGTLALLATFSPWLYAPEEPRRRLVWFGAATLVAGTLAIRAYMTA
jgi:ABC-type spermidine/putrescine transport system permease subunit II